jgi:DNA anti-recombination protein RmuC
MPEENQKPNFYSLYQMVGEIKGEVKGINAHLEKMNGRLDSHSTKINILESTTDQMKGKATGAGAVAGFIAGAISIIIAILAFFRKQL